MSGRYLIFAVVGAMALCSCAPGPDQESSQVAIEQTENGFRLVRNGNPYFINGAGGNQYLDKLLEGGGNSIRRWRIEAEDLAEASRRGLTVMAGIPIDKPRKGFDYSDELVVAAQVERVRATVREFRSHPALLMWALGNETELGLSAEQRPVVWRVVEELARIVKQEDPNHPVITVLAGAGNGKVGELMEHCPSLDAIGINAYGGVGGVPDELARQGWPKAYLITEFGPRGHWEVEKTPWMLPIEDDSTTKAAHYKKGYEEAVAGRPNCLGSYVFLWGDKQERTHTWYGMFLPDGSQTGAVDAIIHSWTGKWPVNRAPEIGEGGLTLTREGVSNDNEEGRFMVGATVHAHVDASDPEGDPLIVKWAVKRDVSNVESTGGDPEEPTPDIPDSIRATRFTRSVIQMPDEPGQYRIFAYVYDAKGSVATVNVPIVVTDGS